ncbi:MAG: N-acetylmuramoyl-L-alanine amidase [Phascolarctobacterium sp.]|nr:N-acetylmuramoyl-L-alanine amidase [Phascolarctobacterium sp.]
MKVFINPGHDLDLDPGACASGLKESEVVAEVGDLVKQYLEAAYVEVVQVLQDDDLDYVCRAANRSGADIFVSIHCNAATNEQASGTETFAMSEAMFSKRLAHYIQDQIVSSCGTVDRGIKFANYYMLKNTTMPAVLVELAFISNKSDALLLLEKKDEFARAIARGITDYEVSLKPFVSTNTGRENNPYAMRGTGYE